LSLAQNLALKILDNTLTDVGLIFSVYNLRRIFNLIDQNLLKQYLKILALHFWIVKAIFNAFYGLFYFENEE
jgi:hypothetical protein